MSVERRAGTALPRWLAIVVLAGAAFTASAQSASPPPRHGFPRGAWSVYDADGDGYLDRAEYYAYRQAVLARGGPGAKRRVEPLDFDAIDTNHDGRISEDEMVAALRAEVGRQRRYRGGRGGQ